MPTTLLEARQTLRALLRRPAATLVALTTLTVGLGATLGIGGLVYDVLLLPLPYPDPGRIVTVWEDHRDTGGPRDEWTSKVVGRTWHEAAGERAAIALWGGWGPTLTGSGQEPTRLTGMVVTQDWFRVFGVEPDIGRVFSEDDADRKATVLSHGLWERLGSDPDIRGRDLLLDGELWTVLGVLPAGFRPPSPVDLWAFLPLRPEDDDLGNAYLRAVGRLAPGATIEELTARLERATQDLASRHPDRMDPVGVTMVPLHERLTGPARPILLALFAAALLVLLVSCVNVSTVQLARFSDRQRELALRSALGASQGRLARLVVLESLLLGILGGGAGTLLGVWTRDLLARAAPTGSLDGAGGIASRFGPSPLFDPNLLLFAVGTSLAAGAAAAVPSLIALWRRRPLAGLREGDDRSGVRSRLRPVLVVVQLGLALALAVGAALLARSLAETLRVDPGFRADAVVTGDLALPSSRYTREERAAFFRTLLERLEARGEVAAAGAVTRVPLDDSGDSDVGLVVEGTPPETDAAVWYRVATPGYFRALRIPVLSGEMFDAAHGGPDRPPVLVNETFARTRLGGRDPATARVRPGGGPDRGEGNPWSRVTGVVSDLHERSLREAPRARIYFLHEQFPTGFLTVTVRATSSATVPAARAALVAEVAALDPDLPVDRLRTMDHRIRAAVATPRFVASLFAAFAGVALFLAGVGVYGLLSVELRARRREIGVRLALGADRGSIGRRFLSHSLRYVLAGASLGIAISFAIRRGLGALLFGVAPGDPAAWLVPTALLVGVSVLATLVPILRATRIHPAVVLRDD